MAGEPAMTVVATMLVRVTTPACERSMPPASMTTVWPVAMTPRKAATCRMFKAWSTCSMAGEMMPVTR